MSDRPFARRQSLGTAEKDLEECGKGLRVEKPEGSSCGRLRSANLYLWQRWEGKGERKG